MRVPLSWIKEYVDLTVPVEELAYRLTLAGLEVGGIEYIGIPAGAVESRQRAVPISTDHLVWDREKVVVGYIHEVKAHPDADRLVLAVVDSGIGAMETVVTGAPNLYPYKGQGPLNPPLIAPYARENAEVIDGHKEDGSRLIIKPRSLRGIENKSMVCSGKELGLSDDHDGIMLLDIDAAPGTPLQDVLGDVVLDIELTPNMARNFSMVGIAREIATLTGQTLRPPSTEVAAVGPTIEGQVGLDIREPDLNPRFTLALIKGVKVGPSPEWMQRRLRLAAMRPINNIVDITNYVMLETGQPLHAFDYDVLVERAGGKMPTIITRLPDKGETLTTLDDVERKLDDFTILVADTAGALSLGGIMGGAESEINDASAEDALRDVSTTNVLLEAANWNFINMRQTFQAQRERGKEISSEAGARFSRGVHPAQAEVGLRRAIEMMREIAGGTIAADILDDYPGPAQPVIVDLPVKEVERLLGIALSQDEITNILKSLDFGVEKIGADAVRATVPDHRLDIGLGAGDVNEDIGATVAQADLIEEIARIYGYDRIPVTLIADEMPPQRANVALNGEERVRDALVRAGLQEIITYRLTTPDHEAQLTPAGSRSDWPGEGYVTLANPISQDKTVMRHTLVGSMLDVVAANSRWSARQALFEIGNVYLPVKGQKLPDEPARVCIALTGPRHLTTWQDGGAARDGLMDFYDLKGIVEQLAGALRLTDVRFEPCEHSTFFPGRTACVMIGDTNVGTLGELHPLVQEALGLPEQPVLAAELDMTALISSLTDLDTITPISNYPAIYQDIALVVREGVAAADIEAAIWSAGGGLLQEVRLFDVYRGEQIGAGNKSLAYALTFQAENKTLRDKDADALRSKIVRALEARLGAELRA